MYYYYIPNVRINDDPYISNRKRRGSKTKVKQEHHKYYIIIDKTTYFMNPFTLTSSKELNSKLLYFEKDIREIYWKIPKPYVFSDDLIEEAYIWQYEYNKMLKTYYCLASHLKLFKFKTSPTKLKTEVEIYSGIPIVIYDLVQYIYPKFETGWLDPHQLITDAFSELITLNVKSSLITKKSQSNIEHIKQIWKNRITDVKQQNLNFLGNQPYSNYPALSLIFSIVYDAYTQYKKDLKKSSKPRKKHAKLIRGHDRLINAMNLYVKGIDEQIFKIRKYSREPGAYLMYRHRGEKQVGKLVPERVSYAVADRVYLCRNISTKSAEQFLLES